MTAGFRGGVGCGKSTVTRLLELRGFRRLDADQIVREQIMRDPAVVGALRDHFGSGILALDGQIDRAALANHIFSDDRERLWLEGFVHPKVYASWRTAMAAEPDAPWVIEVPLLYEKALENWFDFTVCVACAPDQQLARLEQRGLPRGLAGQRISKQLPLARKIEQSDFVIWNEGSPEFLEQEVDRLADALSAAWRRLVSPSS
jgi:dephospho-CoA kinase